MAFENILPRDIKENTPAMTEPTVKYTLNQEVKSEKYESKVLVLGSCRCFLYTTKVPAKLEATIHYLDIQGIESSSAANLRLTLKNGKVLTFAARAESEEVIAIITHIGSALVAVFSTVPFERLVAKLDVHPAARAKAVQDAVRDASPKDTKPCDGFSSIYAYMCDYLGYTVIDEVTWDIDTIYSSQDARSFSLCDFNHLSSSDHVPLLAALQYCTWFTHFNAADMKLSSEMLSRILKVVKTSMALESMDLSNSGLKVDSVIKFASAISANVSSKLTDLDLSNNALEDKGITALSATIAKLPRGLCRINLAKTGMTAKGASKLAEALVVNGQCVSTLRLLNLSGNSIKGDEMQHLQIFLAKPNVLEEFDVSGGGASLEQLISPMASGCVKHLRALKVSGNPYTIKKSKEPPPYWKQFFSTAQSLDHISLSNTSLTPTALKALLLGLSVNSSAAAAAATISLDVSHNSLGVEGAGIISACVHVLKNIGSLDLTNNGMEDGLPEMLASFTMKSSIRHLAIGQNFSFVKSKHMTSALDALVQVMQSDHSVLESLSVSNSRLGPDTSRIINALGSNMTIKKIDLSGNDMGDECAKMLAKALSINACLTSLSFDRNNLTAVGLSDIANAIQRNLCLKDVPLPLDDIILASKLEPDKVKAAVETIQKSLLRNYDTQRIPRGSLYRLQENLHAGSAQGVIDKRLSRLQSLVSAESGSGTAGSKSTGQHLSVERVNQIEMARKDVASAKKAMMKLHSIAQHSESESGAMFVQVGRLSEQLVTAIQTQAQNSAQEMLQSMQEGFPFVFSFSEFTKNELLAGCKSRILEEGAVSYGQTSRKQIVTDARNELSRLNVSVASYLFDHVVDKLLLALDEVGRSAPASEVHDPILPRPPIGEHKDFRNGNIKSSTEEETAAPSTYQQGSSSAASSTAAATAAATLATAPATAATTTRKALLDGRKRRPQSMHQDEKAAQPASGHIFGAGLSRRLRKGSEGAALTQGGKVSSGQDDDLDVVVLSLDVPQLSHPTKDRPKPQRVHAPMQKPAADDQAFDESGQKAADDDASGQAADGLVPGASSAAKTASGATPKKVPPPSSSGKQPALKPPALKPEPVSASSDRAPVSVAASAAANRGRAERKDADGWAAEGRPADGLAQPPSQTGAALDKVAAASGAHAPGADTADRSDGSATAAALPALDTPLGDNQSGESSPRPQAPLRAKKTRSKRDQDGQCDTASAAPDKDEGHDVSLLQGSLNDAAISRSAAVALVDGPASTAAAGVSRDGVLPAPDVRRFSHVPTNGTGKNLVAELKARGQRASAGLVLEESPLESAGDFEDRSKGAAFAKSEVSPAADGAAATVAKSIRDDGARKPERPAPPATAAPPLSKPGAAAATLPPPLPTKPLKPTLVPRSKQGGGGPGPSDGAAASADATGAPSKELPRSTEAAAIASSSSALPGQRLAGNGCSPFGDAVRPSEGDGAAAASASSTTFDAACPTGDTAAALSALAAEVPAAMVSSSSASLRQGPVLVPPSSAVAVGGRQQQQRVVSMPPDGLYKRYKLPSAATAAMSSSAYGEITETTFDD